MKESNEKILSIFKLLKYSIVSGHVIVCTEWFISMPALYKCFVSLQEKPQARKTGFDPDPVPRMRHHQTPSDNTRAVMLCDTLS